MGFKSKQYGCNKLVIAGFLVLWVGSFHPLKSQELLFMGEGKVNEVKLFWLPDAWPDSLRGFNVFRRIIIDDSPSKWKTLNELPIEPGNSIVKTLNNITNSNNVIRRLTFRRNQLMKKNQGNHLDEISRGEIIRAFKNEDSKNMLSLMFSMDFDIPLLCGFAYYDMGIPPSEMYEYAIQKVYFHSVSPLIETFNWKYGDEKKRNISATANIKKTQQRVKVAWSVNTEIFQKDQTLNGFNIYRIENNLDTIRLNSSRVLVNTDEPVIRVFYNDNNASDTNLYHYALAPVNIFNNEGTWNLIEYQAKNYLESVPAPTLKRVFPENDLDNEKIFFEWSFKKRYEPYITGFIVQRKINNDNYISISDTLSVYERQFVDNPGNENRNKHLVYRIIAIRQHEFNIWSNPYPFVYKPVQQLTAPKGLKGKLVSNNNNYHVHLEWGPMSVSDTITVGYVLYTNHGGEYFGREANLPLIERNQFNYSIEKINGAKYLFAVAAMNNEKKISELSDTIEILTPTKTLPVINTWPVEQISKTVKLNWNYSSTIPDLKGFRVYMNNQLVADESMLGPDSKSWTSPELEAGKYVFQMIAVSVFDIQSKRSKPRYFTIKE